MASMETYRVPEPFAKNIVNQTVEHSSLGLRAQDGWPRSLTLPDGQCFHRAESLVTDGELVRVTYVDWTGKTLYVYND